MTITGALVLFAVIWFMGLFIALPLSMKSQHETGHVVEGTPASAPDDPKLKKKFIWVTITTTILWLPLCWFISSGILSIRDIDFFNRM